MDKLGKMLEDEAKQYALDQAEGILDHFLVAEKLQQLLAKPLGTPASSIPSTSQSAMSEQAVFISSVILLGIIPVGFFWPCFGAKVQNSCAWGLVDDWWTSLPKKNGWECPPW
eukprot:EG_transcript_48887